MKHETLETAGLAYVPCQYNSSRLTFRGPKRDTSGQYVAFVGGADTYGKFIERPYPRLIEAACGRPCVNLGVVNASIDAFVHDPAVVGLCAGAAVTVVQVMGAQNLSNRFYRVHPRRNDRFLDASSILRVIYPEVDFSEIAFTGHLLKRLYDVSPERFDIVRGELEQAWVARMRLFLSQIGANAVLMWFASRPMDDTPWHEVSGAGQLEPAFVTKTMVDQLRPLVKDVVEVRPSRAALAEGTTRMVVPLLQTSVAAERLSVRCHQEAAEQLLPHIMS